MKIDARAELLRILRFAARASHPASGGWRFAAREGSHSVSDAEQLLCLLLPLAQVPDLRVDRPDQTPSDLAAALSVLGGPAEIPYTLVDAIIAYLERYRAPDGTPIFSGGGYTTVDGSTPADAQMRLDVVEGFAVSVPLSLVAVDLARTLSAGEGSLEVRARLASLRELASHRLTAAMVGLLRGFVIDVFERDSPSGQHLIRTVNTLGQAPDRLLDRLKRDLASVTARLATLDIGILAQPEIAAPENIYECGWSWGVSVDAPMIQETDGGRQRPGHAVPAPYLYATVAAMDAIALIDSDWVEVGNLLTNEQRDLAYALQTRMGLAADYWRTVATYGPDWWPLEDIPWKATDGQESEFFSLLVASLVARPTRRGGEQADPERLERALAELAVRARVTRRPTYHDSALDLHWPGVPVTLFGSGELGSADLLLPLTTFAPLLLRETLRLAEATRAAVPGRQLVRLADRVWEHLRLRTFAEDPHAGLWDQPANVFADLPPSRGPSWQHTLRIVESLIVAARIAESEPPSSPALVVQAQDLLAEAEHLFDAELARGTAEAGPEARLLVEQCRQRLAMVQEIMARRPGTAIAELHTVLRDLNQLAIARRTSGH